MSAAGVAVTDRQGPVERLSEEYSASARAYARHWGPTIRPLALSALDRLPLDRAERVLDVGTGTGDLLPDLRARAPRAAVIGVDRSAGMLAEAAARGRGPLALMDARGLALPSSSIDVVVLAFLLFHLPRPVEALREAGRVLRSGGAVGAVTWAGESPPLPAERIWAEELDRAGARPDPRPGSVRRYGAVDTPEKCERLLGRAGLCRREARIVRLERRWEPGELTLVRRSCGPTGRRLAALPTAERRRCVARAARRTARLSPEELVWRPAVVHAVGRVDPPGAP